MAKVDEGGCEKRPLFVLYQELPHEKRFVLTWTEVYRDFADAVKRAEFLSKTSDQKYLVKEL